MMSCRYLFSNGFSKINILEQGLCKSIKFGEARSFSSIKVTESDNVKHVLLSNSKARNVLSLKTLEELNEAILNISSHVRCIILRAEGKVFSAGHDVKELTEQHGKEYHTKIFDTCSKLMVGMLKSPVPIIAEVNGVAAAAGCQLVATCDIVVASNKSTFITPGANAGIFCSTPGIPLIRSVPLKIAADMLLTGLPISAEQALNVGLVSVVVPEDKLDAETQLRVQAILKKSRAVLALGKTFMYEQMQMSIAEAYIKGGLVMVSNINMKDGQEGIMSFNEKRLPIWSHES